MIKEGRCMPAPLEFSRQRSKRRDVPTRWNANECKMCQADSNPNADTSARLTYNPVGKSTIMF